MDKFNGAKPLVPTSEVNAIKRALEEIEGRRTGAIKSLRTAWRKFDDALLDGIEWNTITAIGARPGTGKTYFAEQLVDDIIKNNEDQEFRVLKFQFEMTDKASGIRKLSMNIGRTYKELNSTGGYIVDEADMDNCFAYYNYASSIDRINVLNDPCTVDEFCATIDFEISRYSKKDENGKIIPMPLLVVIDHSALFKKSQRDKDKFNMLYNLGEAMTYMKKNYPVSFIVLSQLNRNIEDPNRAKEGEYGNYVLDSDIFGADALLQHCDVLIGINRPAAKKIRYYGPDRFIIPDENTLVFHFLKCRNGDTRISFFRLNRDTMRIEEMDAPPTARSLTTR